MTTTMFGDVPTHGRVASRPPRGGSRVLLGFEAAETLPANVVARDEAIDAARAVPFASSRFVAAVESDLALLIAVMRLAETVAAPKRLRAESVVEAVAVIPPVLLETVVGTVPTYDYFDYRGDAGPDAARLHAAATQRFADRIAVLTSFVARDRLLVSSALHDIGRVVLETIHPEYHQMVGRDRPETRLERERRRFGMDHAMVGAILARRWRLPVPVCAAIEEHHDPGVNEEAAIIRLADMLAHYSARQPVGRAELVRAGHRLGIDEDGLRRLLFEAPLRSPGPERRVAEVCPLSRREHEVLRLLAEGKVYKEIGQALGLASSTVRSHLHNIYGKLGVGDRAQAVLLASDCGWL